MGSCVSGLPGREKVSQHDEKKFLEAYPAYKNTTFIDHLRKTEYSTLDRDGHMYLDYTGAGLYSETQLREHHRLLSNNIFGNPHSLNPTSSAATTLAENARASVLDFFRASHDEYTVIFTTNASGALKLLGESYPFSPEAEYILLADNHNSVLGIREFAHAKGATVTYLPLTSSELRTDDDVIDNALRRKSEVTDGPRLFAYPAQSNFSGVQHPLEWIAAAQAQGCHVLLDAAAFVPTNRLDLSVWHPDFVPVSFYKMFGYPSGVGCLIARKAALESLTRPWFGGGTIWGSSALAGEHVLLEDHEGFEDGTINYLNLPAVHMGLLHLQGIGMEAIHERVTCLSDWLMNELLSLHHQDGQALVKIYGPRAQHMRGATIAFNFIDTKGCVVDERIVEKRGNAIKLSLRSGCFCNPGAGEAAFDLHKDTVVHAIRGAVEYEAQHGERRKWDDFLFDLGMPTAGAIRISLGLVSNFADAYRFVQFARTFLDSVPTEKDLEPRLHC